MKKEKEQIIPRWRKLDNSAKLFPILATKKFSSMFRVSVILKEDIDPSILKEAVIKSLEIFDSFNVRLRHGFFWYYFETNPKEPIIEIENDYPCKPLNRKMNNDYVFKVTYYNKKINLDVFHSLTDGNSAADFMKEIVYTYIELKYKDKYKSVEKRLYNFDTEDSYLRNYDKKLAENDSSKKAYMLKGNRLPLYATGVIHGKINLKQFKILCKEKGVTITEYLTANLIYAIYTENVKRHPSKRPIKVCIPVNLKKYFDSKTISNFFSYITVIAETSKEEFNTFDDILEFVKADFSRKLNREELTKIMSFNVNLGRNLFIRLLPLFLKRVALKMSYIEIRKYTTTTLSNVGVIDVLPEYKEYIEDVLILIAPGQGEKIKCSVCSYNDSINFTFSSILEETYVERAFFENISKNGIDIEIESNGVYNERM